jgi:hypothetical protein
MIDRKARAYLMTGDAGYASRMLPRGRRRGCWACMLEITGPCRDHVCRDDHLRSRWREARGEDTYGADASKVGVRLDTRTGVVTSARTGKVLLGASPPLDPSATAPGGWTVV